MIAEVEAQEEKVRLNFIPFKDQLLEAKRRGLLDEKRYQKILAEMEAGMAEICRDVAAFRRRVLEEDPDYRYEVRFSKFEIQIKCNEIRRAMVDLRQEFAEKANKAKKAAADQDRADLKAELKAELKDELKIEALRKELKEVRDEKATLASDLISVRTKADRLEAEVEELRVALAASTTADTDAAHGE